MAPVQKPKPRRAWDPKAMARASAFKHTAQRSVGAFFEKPSEESVQAEADGTGRDFSEDRLQRSEDPGAGYSITKMMEGGDISGQSIAGTSTPLPNSDDDCEFLEARSGDSADLIEVDPEIASRAHEAAKKVKTPVYEKNRVFQDIWSIKHPWAESVLDPLSGRATSVKCIICSKIDGRPHLLSAKSDTLSKHSGRRRAPVDMTVDGKKLKAGETYVDKRVGHVRNEKTWLMQQNAFPSVVEQLSKGPTILKRKKMVQFALMFHLLQSGLPMKYYEGSEALFQLLEVPNMPKGHWSDGSGVEIVRSLSYVVEKKTKEVLQAANCFSLSADEVTSIDNCHWLSCHVYVVQNFKRVPILLSLRKVIDGCNAENLHSMIVSDLNVRGGLSDTSIAERLVSFGADGASVFQGVHNGVTAMLKQRAGPYLIGVHCFAHRTDLAVDKLSTLPMVEKLEILISNLHSYFAHSPKRHEEFCNLALELDTGGHKILKNNKTRWISLIAPLRRILDEYKTLVVFFSKETTAKGKKNFSMLCDISNLLALPCILPLLESVQELIKTAQARDVYVGEFLTAMRICQLELNQKYLDVRMSFSDSQFVELNDIVFDRSPLMSQQWIRDVESGESYLHFRIGEQSFSTHIVNAMTSEKRKVNYADFQLALSRVKESTTVGAELVISELDFRFPQQDVMNAFSIVYPQFWKEENCEDLFEHHLEVLKKQYATVKSVQVGDGSSVVPRAQVTEPLNGRLLIQQQGSFKMTMRAHCDKACEWPVTINPLTKLWQSISSSRILKDKLSSYVALTEIAIVTVLGSVEDERTFSTVAFMKNRVRNRLDYNLDPVVRMFSQGFFTLQNFPFADAIEQWETIRDRRMTTD